MIKSLTNENSDLKTQIVTNAQYAKDERNNANLVYSKFQNLKIKLEAETDKRILLEKRVKKFLNWLQKDQKIYIEGILGKLGVEEKEHKRSTSCIDVRSNNIKMSRLI